MRKSGLLQCCVPQTLIQKVALSSIEARRSHLRPELKQRHTPRAIASIFLQATRSFGRRLGLGASLRRRRDITRKQLAIDGATHKVPSSSRTKADL